MKYGLKPGDRRGIRLRFDIEGYQKSYLVTQEQLGLLKAMVARWHLPFEFDTRDSWVFMRAKGIVLNSSALVQWEERKRNLRELQSVYADYGARIEEAKARVADRPHLSLVDEELIQRFISTLTSWDEVLEAGRSGEELARVSPRFTVAQDARLGVRLQPARFRKYVMGREFWGLTPPMPFSIHADHIQAQLTGHPHVYAALNICTGNAQFDYSNPFQSMGMLREWYVGYSEKDVADKDWKTHSRMWWKGFGESFFESGEALVIEGPDAEREKSALVELTRADVEAWCRSSGWVPGRLLDEEPEVPEPQLVALERWGGGQWQWMEVRKELEARACEVCGALSLNVLKGRSVEHDAAGNRPSIALHLCACHLAELGLIEARNYQELPAGDHDLVLIPGGEEMCDPGHWWTEDAVPSTRPVGTQPAVGAIDGWPVCLGHANLLRGVRGELKKWVELDKLILSGELGGVKPARTVLEARFPVPRSWRSKCTDCGEELHTHWGVTCPRDARFRLEAGEERNRLGYEAWSRWDFSDEEKNAEIAEVVTGLKAKFSADHKLKGENSFADMVRRLCAADGKALDGEEGARRHWVEDTLRKFGAEVTPQTLCVDCGRPWGRGPGGPHNGPDCMGGA